MQHIKRNMPEIIADELRQAIISGSLQPGERLKQQDLANRFSASLIPVREALRLLENERFVSIYPNKGAVVSSLSAEELRQLFDVRIIIESAALIQSIPHLTTGDFTELERIIQSMNRAQRHIANRLNKDFHQRLYSGSRNQYLIQIVFEHYAHTERYLNLYLSEQRNFERSQHGHLALIEAAKVQDLTRARAILAQHITDAMESLLEQIDE